MTENLSSIYTVNKSKSVKYKILWGGEKLLFLLLLALLATPSYGQIRDRINAIKGSDPLSFSGTVGTSVAISYNSSSLTHATPFSTTLFGSFNFNIYSFNLPVSFYFINNSTQFSYPHPSISLGMTPSWKNFRFHLGYSSMHFSNYTYSGLSFLGVGVEYHGKLFRAAAFGGHLNQATKPKGYDDRSAFQQLADSLLGLNVPQGDYPQYRRDAVGVKIGVGNDRNFIDLSVLKAKDDEKSLSEIWRDTLKAKENLALGVSGRFAIGKWFSFTTNVGASLYTDDISVNLLDAGERYAKLIKGTQWLYGVRYNSQIRFAGDAAMNFHTKVFNGSLTYRFIQPEYTSLGTQKFSQNTNSYGLNTNFIMFKGKSILALVGYLQRDNLNKKQMYTNQVATYTLNSINNISENFSLNLSYNGIKQNQFNGTQVLNPATKIDQITHTASFTPVFSIPRRNVHSINLNFNFVANSNLNKEYQQDINAQTYTAGVGYGIDLTQIKLGISAGYDFSASKSYYSSYLSNGISVGLNYRLYSTEKTNWTFNYNASAAYNLTKDYDKVNTVSLSNSLGSNFSYKKAHTASLYLSLSNFSENIVIGQKIATDLDLRFTLSYRYSFGVKIIKKKTEEQKNNKKVVRIEKKALRIAKKNSEK